MGSVAVKIDCTACGQTGYSNFWTQIEIPVFYIPGAIKRWNAESGALSFIGESAIKIDTKYQDILANTDFIKFNGIEWKFSVLEDPGSTLGQPRLVYALTRR